jgi:hypothetical protein
MSFYMSSAIILTAQFVGDVWSIDTLKNWLLAMKTAGISTRDTLAYLRDLTQAAARGEVDSWSEFIFACAITGLVACLLYVLIGAPLRAGFWTGRKARRHKMHRYMGLSYLLQYGAAWVVYCTHYEQAKDSYLSHFIAINGMNWGFDVVMISPSCLITALRSFSCRSYSRIFSLLFFQGVARTH